MRIACHIRKYYGHVNSLRWWQNTTTLVKHYGRVSGAPCFPGMTSPQRVFFYGDSKLLRRSRFDTAGSFGKRGTKKCPEFLTTNFAPSFIRQFAAAKTKFHGVFRSAEVCPSQISLAIPQFHVLAHQNRTIAIAGGFCVDGAKSPKIPQEEGVWGSEIAARNRKSLVTFHRTLKSQFSIAFSCLGNRCDFFAWNFQTLHTWTASARLVCHAGHAQRGSKMA